MQSILVVSKNKNKFEQYLQNLFNEFSISHFDVIKIESVGTIGIEEVRTVQKNLLLKPNQGALKAVIFESAHTLTLAAQNSLLKILEEPPNHTIIILQTLTKEQLLPTILSRCKIIELNKEDDTLSNTDSTQYLNILISLMSNDIVLRLKLAQDIAKTKQSSIDWVENMILSLRQKIIELIMENPSNSLISKYHNILISLNSTHVTLTTTNTNPRFTLENLFLNI